MGQLHKSLVTDDKNRPIAVQIDYADWVAIEDVTSVGLNPQVRNAAIQIRRQYRLKLPDAIICATAQVMNAELLRNLSALKSKCLTV